MRQKCPEYILERSEVSGGLPETFSEVRRAYLNKQNDLISLNSQDRESVTWCRLGREPCVDLPQERASLQA